MSRRDEIELRLAMATPGPWFTDRDDNPNSVRSEHANICGLHDGGQTRDRIDANARFIAHAPDDVRWLLDELSARDQGGDPSEP